MKTITTKIPNNAKKSDYLLMHKSIYVTVERYLNELDKWVKAGAVAEFSEELLHELDALRRL